MFVIFLIYSCLLICLTTKASDLIVLCQNFWIWMILYLICKYLLNTVTNVCAYASMYINYKQMYRGSSVYRDIHLRVWMYSEGVNIPREAFRRMHEFTVYLLCSVNNGVNCIYALMHNLRICYFYLIFLVFWNLKWFCNVWLWHGKWEKGSAIFKI